MLCLSYYLLCFLFNKIREEDRQDLPRSKRGEEGGGRRRGWWGEEIIQTMWRRGRWIYR
jgi:hypothetical protein